MYNEFEVPSQHCNRRLVHMRKIVPILFVIVTLFLFASCRNEAETLQSVDLSSLEKGGTLGIKGVTSRTRLELTDFSLKDGVYIEVGKSRGISSRGDSDESLYEKQSGSFIPVPDESGTAAFSASSLKIGKEADVTVHKMPNLDDDFMISNEEPVYVGKRGLVEEYYYVDFSDPRWAGLDRSEIVVLMTRNGAGQGKIIQHGMLSRSLYGVFDFSDPLIEGFGVYLYSILTGDSDSFIGVSLVNPMHPGAGPITLTEDWSTLLIDRQGSGQYKLEIAVTGDNAQAVAKALYYSGFTDIYLTDGNSRPGLIIKELDYENCVLTYHLGEVNEDFLLTLGMESSYTGFSGGNATLRLLKDEPGIEYHDISNLENPIIVQSDSDVSFIWAFKSDIEQEIEVVNQYKGGNYSSSVSIYNPPLPPEKSMPRPNGFFLVTPDSIGCLSLFSEELEAGTNLFMIKKASQQYNMKLECDEIQWDEVSATYVCSSDDCAACNSAGQKRHYNILALLFSKSILNGCYVTEESYVGYGRIGYENGDTIRLMDSDMVLDSSTTGNLSAGDSYGTYAWSSADTSKKVEIRLKKLSVSGKKIVCDITLGDTEKHSDVVMTLYHDHVWSFSEGVATCGSCGEKRSCVSLNVGPGGPYNITVNGSVILYIPENNYSVTINGSFVTPELNNTVAAYLITTTSGYSIKQCDNDGSNYNITLESVQ